MAICGLTGFLTPLGTTPYTYLIKTMQGNTVSNINEHLPLTLINNIPVMCTLVIFLAFLIFTKVKIRLSDLFMIGGLTYLMFSSRRQSTMFVLIGSIILNRISMDAIEIYSKESLGFVFKQIICVIGILVAGLGIYYGGKFIDKKKDNNYVSTSSYPVEAADWILKNLDVNNIKLFNEYNYGSYLLYRGIPVFIDSRADLYAPEFNGKKAGRQSPSPSQKCSRTRTALPSTMSIAPSWQAFAQAPQPLHLSRSMWMIFLIIWIPPCIIPFLIFVFLDFLNPL